MPRTILHLDLDAFFCAVEEQHNPALRGKPFAVGGAADQRGVVAACSYPARVYGVRSAMPMAKALRLCPDLTIVRAQHGRYGAVSKQVMAVLHELTPIVEQLSIDEAFMDVTGLKGTSEDIARGLQQRINAELGLPCSLGVAANKLIAKTANTVGKARVQTGEPPNSILVVPAGDEAAFLAPLPIRELWGVGPKTADTLNKMGIHTIGELADYPAFELRRKFGKHGDDLSQRARGIDTRRVETEHETKSISKETTFGHDISEETELKRTLRQLADEVGYRLRKQGYSGTTVKLKLRWSDFTTLTRQMTLPHTVDQDEDIYREALALFDAHWPPGKPVRLIGVGVSGLEEGGRQMTLWESTAPENRQLQSTLDDIKRRFGEGAIRRGSTVKKPPTPPDPD